LLILFTFVVENRPAGALISGFLRRRNARLWAAANVAAGNTRFDGRKGQTSGTIFRELWSNVILSMSLRWADRQ
jgi:hypothetical protein